VKFIRDGVRILPLSFNDAASAKEVKRQVVVNLGLDFYLEPK
jgi:hypothetical protein